MLTLTNVHAMLRIDHESETYRAVERAVYSARPCKSACGERPTEPRGTCYVYATVPCLRYRLYAGFDNARESKVKACVKLSLRFDAENEPDAVYERFQAE